MVTVNHPYRSKKNNNSKKNVYSIKPENNVLNAWIEVSYSDFSDGRDFAANK